MRKRFKGFTLVEIMIVVAIIGLLVAIALPNFLIARKKSQMNTCKANLKQIDGAVEQAKLDGLFNATNKFTAVSQLCPVYIKTEPICPTTRVSYPVTNEQAYCTSQEEGYEHKL